MITLHHLRIGRSIFTVWLLEELGLDYELKVYHRNPETFRAQDDIKAATPLGKSPTIEDDDIMLTESGAIAAYLVDRYDTDGRFAPPRTDWKAWAEYLRWLHYPEGSAFLPLFLRMLQAREGDNPSPVFKGFADGEVPLHLGLLDKRLGEMPYILGDTFQAPDIGISYIADMAERLGELAPYTNLKAYHDRNLERDAWKRAKERAVE
ncbi:glutathione S-transferase family protein [Henriciella aquimarina]|uniref:glutathione S-transferase family protein n=1 Tax=Henriciella aquimarina TaxID=545261 RepID=UPI000A011233|nr:glutathione S-transferase family protein [Henriciella aquimarina]